MPTINQIVRKGRGSKTRKSKSPVLNVRLNSLTKRTRELPSPQKREEISLLVFVTRKLLAPVLFLLVDLYVLYNLYFELKPNTY